MQQPLSCAISAQPKAVGITPARLNKRTLRIERRRNMIGVYSDSPKCHKFGMSRKDYITSESSHY